MWHNKTRRASVKKKQQKSSNETIRRTQTQVWRGWQTDTKSMKHSQPAENYTLEKERKKHHPGTEAITPKAP
jgi:hypothetical protein